MWSHNMEMTVWSYMCRLKVVLEHFNWFSVSMVTSEVGLRERKSVLSQFKRGEIKVSNCHGVCESIMNV